MIVCLHCPYATTKLYARGVSVSSSDSEAPRLSSGRTRELPKKGSALITSSDHWTYVCVHGTVQTGAWP